MLKSQKLKLKINVKIENAEEVRKGNKTSKNTIKQSSGGRGMRKAQNRNKHDLNAEK